MTSEARILNQMSFLSFQMTKLCHERWLCLLCLRHQEQACGPSEGWGKPRLDDTSSLLPRSLSLSNPITTRPQGMGPAGLMCQGTLATSKIDRWSWGFYYLKPQADFVTWLAGAVPQIWSQDEDILIKKVEKIQSERKFSILPFSHTLWGWVTEASVSHQAPELSAGRIVATLRPT